MSINFDSSAKLNLVGGRWSVSKNGYLQQGEEIADRMAFDRLRDQLASLLTKEAVRKTENTYSVDYEIRLYVLTPDQLEKYVQRRAMEYGYRPVVTEQTYEA